jgi:16S rRNA (guanine527-N7)-methyltransferase
MPTLTEQAQALLNLNLTADHEALFARFYALLIDWNARMNLTAITAPEEVQVKHFLDSLTVADAVELHRGMRVVDVGTGAGFPGVPLQIVYPGIHMVLMDATGKKIQFLEHVIQALGLANARAVKARAEDAGRFPEHRHVYDLALGRAVARLPILLEYLLPLVKVGGYCVAMKGRTAVDEVNDSARALSVLGGEVEDIESFQLPGIEETHHLIIVRKTALTPSAYPRAAGMPAQKPL